VSFLLNLFIRFPGVFRQLGIGLVSLSVAMIGLGWRLGRRLDRIEHRLNHVGIAFDMTVEKLLPWWISPLVPETVFGFLAWLTIAIVGIALAYTAKRIQRLHY
jgi:hypothetical protein